MNDPFAQGDPVQTPFGKGVVREVRSGGHYLIEVGGKGWVMATTELSPIAPPKGRRARRAGNPPSASGPAQPPASPAREIDLHGLTALEAVAAAVTAISDALVADCRELHLIHGRSGGRLRAALHQRLPGISAVRGFRLDPRNPGVTIVML